MSAKLRAGEELDATRKRVQAEHPDLTLTGLYNVLERIKALEAARSPLPEGEVDAAQAAAGEGLRTSPDRPLPLTRASGATSPRRGEVGSQPPPLTPAEEDVKNRGLVLILKELHEEIDRLTAEANGWPADLADDAILERLVALNAERAREEAAGHVRWLRPDYQIPRFAKGAAAKTGELDLAETIVAIDKTLPALL